MKNALQNLLMVLALGLCVLAAWQWVREAGLRRANRGLNSKLLEQAESIQNLKKEISRYEAEIRRLDELRSLEAGTARTNAGEAARLRGEVSRLSGDLARSEASLAKYKEALALANRRIESQNADIRKQNAALADLTAGRETVVSNYNRLVLQHSNLVAQWNRQQDLLARARQGTNLPAKSGD